MRARIANVDLGDRVRVTGRLGQAPLIEFLSRDAHTSSLAGEKLTEDQVVQAVGGGPVEQPGPSQRVQPLRVVEGHSHSSPPQSGGSMPSTTSPRRWRGECARRSRT